jgi:hypothetical protein
MRLKQLKEQQFWAKRKLKSRYLAKIKPASFKAGFRGTQTVKKVRYQGSDGARTGKANCFYSIKNRSLAPPPK